ncbi:hypothetical protein ABZ619_19080 [Streptomyces sp. NPDC007851]|uniref:hypothetical protein n=1 Tax=Streptomyces sp. NPDC007851 TaxID=3155008 RepID=UPI0033CDF43D
MRMRLSTPLSLCLAAAAVVLVPGATATAVPAAAETSCTGADAQGFPLATRIHDGPSSYEPGGGYGTWYLDLTNTTSHVCTDVHPVVVLVDDHRALKPAQTELEFYDGRSARPVALTETDASELVGVFDGNDFPGFTVAPGATVSVKVRLAVAADAVPNAVTVNAALVQRQGSDGDWVGESNDYRFGIGQDPPPPPPSASASPTASAGTDPTAAPATPDAPATPGAPASALPSAGTEEVSGAATPGASPGTAPTASPDGALPVAVEAAEAGERARELARTGPGLAHGLLTATAALLLVGATASLLARRRP